ncbi:MAG: hypothetical protein NTW21_29475 [Verrucomicrobia bacterium]|nr:hypothetical protein [Verrucomicrobiota bacterium]
MKTATIPSSATRPKRFASVRDLVKATAANDGQVREFDRRINGSVTIERRASGWISHSLLCKNTGFTHRWRCQRVRRRRPSLAL